jgi:DNA-binding CsgD family transcriptional regulator
MSVSRRLPKADGKARRPRPSPAAFNSTDLRLLGLTPRQCEVLRWITEGKRDREIAAILDLSPRTVSNHAHNIFQKLSVETRTAAVRHCAVVLLAVLLVQ